MPLQLGQLLNSRYRVVRLLGQGGFGAVYRAWDANLNKPCAVKENLDTSPEAQRQFTREATVLANLSHPNLPRVTDHFILAGQGQYLVMDFVEGEDLASLVKRSGPVPYEQAVTWIAQVADALIYLHSRQPPVVHRDIKPANIRITPEGKATLVDFGLVKIFDPQLRTTMGARAVTPGYAPPEQYGVGKTDNRTDIYALGATLYNLLTAREPPESVQRMSGGQMALANTINPSIPASIGLAIERSMRLEPHQRFQTADEFRSSLRSPAKPVQVIPSTEPVIRPTTRVSVPPVTQQKPSQRPAPATKSQPINKQWIVVGSIAAVIICVVGSLGVGLLMYGSNGSTNNQTDQGDMQSTLAQRVSLTSTARAGTSVASDAYEHLTATSQSIAENLARLEANKSLVYGPTTGALAHNPTNSTIEATESGVNLRDFIVQANFINPYDTSRGAWDYGFIIRHEGKNNHLRLYIRSDKTWKLINNIGDSEGILITQGELPDLNIGGGGSNHIKLAVEGGRGYFVFNNEIIAELDLSSRLNSGAIYIVTGILNGDEQEGAATEYQDFTIWSIP